MRHLAADGAGVILGRGAAVALGKELGFHVRLDGPKDGRLVSVVRTPFGAVARLESSGGLAPTIATEILLFDGQKKIEFINRVQHARGPRGVWPVCVR